MLAFLTLANILKLSAVVPTFRGVDAPSQSQIWIVFVVSVLFFSGFGSSAYGLFRRRNWGRLIFLWTITIWSGFNFVALFIPAFSPPPSYTTGDFVLDIFRYGAGLFLPLWYLNLPWIKTVFHDQTSEDFVTEGNNNQ